MDELETGVLATSDEDGVVEEDIDELAAGDEAAIAAERSAAIGRLREALLATDPAIDPELVRGDSVEELETSFAAARALVARVREAVRLEQAAAIPAGSATRETARPASAFEKIRKGLAGR